MTALTPDQAKGMLLGLAVGDAAETDAAGVLWSSHTALALCTGDSLLQCKGWHAGDCANRFVRCRDDGYMCPAGKCTGGTDRIVSEALDRFLSDGDPYSGSGDPATAGYGGLMRIAPAVIAHHKDAMAAVDISVLQSQITHARDECDDFAFALSGFLHSGNLQDALHRCNPDVHPNTIKSGIAVRKSYEAAFLAFENTTSFAGCIPLAVSSGHSGAASIAGQIAGRVYGASGIPAEWLEKLTWRENIEIMAAELFALGA